MLVQLASAMTVTAVILELWLVTKYEWLLRLFEHNTLLAIAFSLLLSWLLGLAFGAGGVIMLLSAVASTLVTATVYKSGAFLVIKPIIQLLANAKVRSA